MNCFPVEAIIIAVFVIVFSGEEEKRDYDISDVKTIKNHTIISKTDKYGWTKIKCIKCGGVWAGRCLFSNEGLEDLFKYRDKCKQTTNNNEPRRSQKV
jgi:hypothetical protein